MTDILADCQYGPSDPCDGYRQVREQRDRFENALLKLEPLLAEEADIVRKALDRATQKEPPMMDGGDTIKLAAAHIYAKAEMAVELLCEKSQHPGDDFDLVASELGHAADRLAQFLDDK